jgi:beta-glucosidase
VTEELLTPTVGGAATPAAALATLPDDAMPAGFLWGAGTAAYQIEGAVAEDGRGPSIWDTFSHRPGTIRGGGTGDVAVDHYHRYRDDVGLAAELGLTAYRFSVAWPRVQPAGSGPANERGLDFYRRLVDELLARGIEPWVTLYHWDLPQPLEDAGGWPVRDTAPRFADFAALVHEALADRVRSWTTVNEPWCAAFLGYASGEHAPGRQEPAASVRAAHHLLLGHGLAAQAMRAQQPRSRIGVSPNLYPVSPASSAEADVDAARRIDGLQNRLFLDPLLLGHYPADVLADLAAVTDFAHVRPGDLAVIAQPLDMVGINYYTRHVVAAAEGSAVHAAKPAGPSPPPPFPGSEHVRFVQRGRPATAMGWEVEPAGLTEILVRVAADYPAVPLYVTENGAAFADVVDGDGRVRDRDRLAYVEAHLRACRDAIAAGVDLRGYFAWSLLDNFEWGWGYDMRFGLAYVDFGTQRRIIKDSGHWFAAAARSNRVRGPVEPDGPVGP